MAMRRRPRLVSQIYVVPYIDVMLVLLVIFMVTAPMMTPGVIDLPTMGKSSQPPIGPLEVVIRASCNMSYVDRSESGISRAVTREQLVTVIKSKQEARPEQPVVISADKAVRYEQVMQVMDLLQRNQVQRVGLLAVPKG